MAAHHLRLRKNAPATGRLDVCFGNAYISDRLRFDEISEVAELLSRCQVNVFRKLLHFERPKRHAARVTVQKARRECALRTNVLPAMDHPMKSPINKSAALCYSD